MKKLKSNFNNCEKYAIAIIIALSMTITAFSQNYQKTYSSDIIFVSIDGDEMRLEQDHSIDVSLIGKNLIMEVSRNGVRTRRYNAVATDDERKVFHITSIEAKYGKFYPQDYNIIMRDYTIELTDMDIRVSFKYLINE